MAWLLPREHGAYGQLAFPLVAALGSGMPTAAAILLIVAFVAAFAAYEPLLVLMGQRGPRARRERADDAIRTLALTAVIALVDAGIAVWLMRPPLRWTVLIPAGFALASIPLILQKRQKTAIGEMHVVLMLSSCAVPVAAAAGLRPQEGAGIWFVLTLGLWASTLAVRATIALQRREPSALSRVGSAIIAIASPFIVMPVAARFGLHPMLWMATLPLSSAALLLAATPPSARRLKTVGWALIGGGSAATILLIVLNRV